MLKRLLPLLAGSFALLAQAQTSTPVTLQLEEVATGLPRLTDISHCGDDRLFLVLQAGVIRIMDGSEQLITTPFLTITDRVNDAGNEQGLLGLAFPPDYATTGFFYVHYTGGSGNGSTRISRFSVTSDPNVADPASEQIIYTWPQPYSNHNGGDLAFGADGYLYIGLGDGGSAGDPLGNAQDFTDPLGNMLRIDVSDPDTTYTIPPSNPFAASNNDTLPEIWASGLRNPFRFGFDALTGDLWIGDVGQNAYEEVDFWPAGDNSHPNFGWRCYEANTAYNTAGCEAQNTYVAPVSVHQQTAQGWCSVIGGRVYRGTNFWRLDGRYIYTDYCGGHYYSLLPNGSGGWTRTQLLSSAQVGFACIGENSALELYAGNNSSGKLYKLKEQCPMAAPVITEENYVFTSTEADSYQWYLNGTVIAGATEQTYTATGTGTYAVLGSYAGGCNLASNTIYVGFTGVAEMNSTVTMQPVPATTSLRIDGLMADAVDVVLLDAAGRVAARAAHNVSGTVVIPVADLANGAYVAQVRNADGAVLVRRQVLVQH